MRGLDFQPSLNTNRQPIVHLSLLDLSLRTAHQGSTPEGSSSPNVSAREAHMPRLGARRALARPWRNPAAATDEGPGSWHSIAEGAVGARAVVVAPLGLDQGPTLRDGSIQGVKTTSCRTKRSNCLARRFRLPEPFPIGSDGGV